MRDLFLIPINMIGRFYPYFYSYTTTDQLTMLDDVHIIFQHYDLMDATFRDVKLTLENIPDTSLCKLVSVEEVPNDDEVICSNCGNIVPTEEVSNIASLANDGNICYECINDGYGR